MSNFRHFCWFFVLGPRKKIRTLEICSYYILFESIKNQWLRNHWSLYLYFSTIGKKKKKEEKEKKRKQRKSIVNAPRILKESFQSQHNVLLWYFLVKKAKSLKIMYQYYQYINSLMSNDIKWTQLLQQIGSISCWFV